MRWAKALIHDIRFQWRHGFYAVYAIISALYILFLRFVPKQYQAELTVTILYSDPSFLGFYFVGGIVLLEKAQRVLQPLWVTPLSLSEYVGAKLVSLSLLSSLFSIAIAMGVHGFSGKSLLMIIGIFFSSICFTCWGMILVARVQTINAFLVGSQVFLLPIVLPLLGYWGVAGGLWTEIWPGSAAISLLEWALSKPFVSFPLHEFLLLIAWCAVSFYGAKRSFEQALTEEWGGLRT